MLVGRGRLELGFVALAVGSTLVVLIAAWSFAAEPEPSTAFDRTIWMQAGAEESTAARAPMLDDVTSNLLREGMTRDEVLAVLGRPDASSERPRRQRNGKLALVKDWEYYAGPVGLLGMDHEWLRLGFSSEGKLIGWLVVVD